jgi:hypothetical protein
MFYFKQQNKGFVTVVLPLLLPYNSSKDMDNTLSTQSKIISNLALTATIADKPDSLPHKGNHSSCFLALKLIRAEKALLH